MICVQIKAGAWSCSGWSHAHVLLDLNTMSSIPRIPKRLCRSLAVCGLLNKTREESKKFLTLLCIIWYKKKNGLPGSCAVFVPQNNIILPFGSSREIQEQKFPKDLQENFITVAVLLATLLRASVFLKQRKKNIVQTYFRVWNHFQLFDFGQIDHSDLIVPQFQSNSVVIQWIQSVFLPPLLWFLKNCMCFPYSLPSIVFWTITLWESFAATFYFLSYVGLFILHLFI